MTLSKKFAAAVMSVVLLAGGITGVTASNGATTPSAGAEAWVISPGCKAGGRYARNVGAKGRYVQYHKILTKKNGKRYWRYYNRSGYRSIYWSAPWNTPGTAIADAGTTCWTSGWNLRY